MALAEFIVAFREFFEIAAVLGVMLAYLHKSNHGKLSKYVWAGAAAAGVASVAAALLFETVAGGFEQHEKIFEGITLVVAAGFVTWLILWMFGQKNVAEGIKQGVRRNIGGGSAAGAEGMDGRGFGKERGLFAGKAAGLAAFAFVAVFREGIEIVLFFWGIKTVAGGISLIGALAGAAGAFALAFAVFGLLVRLDLGKFFTVTGAILVLMAGGLLGQGVHELEEAGGLPPIIEHVYNLNPAQNADGSYPPLHEKGVAGSMLKSIVGYDANPSALQLAVQLAYYAAAFVAYRKMQRN